MPNAKTKTDNFALYRKACAVRGTMHVHKILQQVIDDVYIYHKPSNEEAVPSEVKPFIPWIIQQDVNPEAIFNKVSQTRKVVRPKGCLMLYFKKNYRWSDEQIANVFGYPGRPTTALLAVRTTKINTLTGKHDYDLTWESLKQFCIKSRFKWVEE